MMGMEAELSLKVMEIVFYVGMGIFILFIINRMGRKIFGSKVFLFIVGLVLGRVFMKKYGGQVLGFMKMTDGSVKEQLSKYINRDVEEKTKK